MTANRIIHHIFNQPDLRQVDQAALEQLVEKYPYFAAARMLLARKEFTGQKDLTAAALKQAQLYSTTPQQVYQFITSPEPAALPVVEAEAPVAVAEKVEVAPVVPEVEEVDAPAAVMVEEEAPAVEEVDIPAAVIVEEEAPAVEEVDMPAAVIVEEAPAAPEVEELDTPAAIIENKEAHTTPEIENIAPPAPVMETVEEVPTPAAAETDISAEDQAILDELAAEDARNAAAKEAIAEKAVPVETTPEIEAAKDEVTVEEATAEIAAVKEEGPLAEAKAEAPDAEDEAIAAKYDEFLYAEKEPAQAGAPHQGNQTEKENTAPDEIVAIDYEAEKEIAEFETARTQSAPDEIVAIDYEAEKEIAEFDTARTQSAPDEIVAIDYEAEKEIAEFETARTQSAPDDIVAVDYDAFREEVQEAPHYEPEPEDEDILVETAAPEGAGLTLPAAPETEPAETAPAETEPAAADEGPIRIHPMDTPVEETTLTFQPLYTDDYFAYKKLKDPNSAEMMTDKAAAEMRSFTAWLKELKDNFAGKATKDWYHQQLNKLYEDDEPEVSERVEKMAIESITFNDDIVSETLAEIWVRQHQHGKAIAVYQKLSLLNPDKNAYFAQKIKDLQLLTDNNK